MPAFNLEHEQRRLSETGLSYGSKIQSAKDSLRTLVSERTHTPSFFSLKAKPGMVTSVGYEHRGDLDDTFQKSEEEAATRRIEQRYALENEGYRRVKEKFFSVPLYSTIMLISPPPDELIPGYPGHTPVYFYHVLPGKIESEREIKALSYDTWFERGDLAEILNSLNPDAPVLPTEQSILTSPVVASGGRTTESFYTLWNSLRNYFRQKGYTHFKMPPAEVLEQYLLHGEELMRGKHLELDIMMESLAFRLAAGATRGEIEDDFDTLLGTADSELLHKDWGHQPTVHMNIPRHGDLDKQKAAIIFQQNRHLGQNVRQVMTFCGISGGMKSTPFGKGSNEQTINTWSFTATNSSEQTQEQTTLCCTCPFCEKEVEAIIGGGRIKCPECKKSAPWVPQPTKYLQ